MEERRESEDLKLTYLLPWPTCFSDRLGWQLPRVSLLELGLGLQDEWGGEQEKICVMCWRWGQRGMGD